jgi:ribosomal-protein-alanine acetyltransferase
MTIRRLTSFDSAEMAELEGQCFSLPWSLESIKSELQSPISFYYGAFTGGKMAGYAGMQIILDEGYIANIATSPAQRRMGIAGALMRELMALAGERKLSFVTLEVRESNIPAQTLYGKFGFTIRGKRKGYYDEPKEDAVIMTREK